MKRGMNLIFQITLNKNTIISNSRHRMLPKVTYIAYNLMLFRTLSRARDIHNIYVEFYTSRNINTACLPVTCKLTSSSTFFVLLFTGLSNIFQYDLTTHLNETFCIRLFEAFCIRLTHVQRTYFEIAGKR